MSTEPFVKLLSSITDSSVWSYDDQTRLVWITLLAMADRGGFIHAAIPGIANRARVSLEATERALEIFMSPDPYSRNPDNDGRRIVKADGGFFILNYSKVRNLRDLEKSRERKRKWWRENRSKEAISDADLDQLDLPLDELDQTRHFPSASASSSESSSEEGGGEEGSGEERGTARSTPIPYQKVVDSWNSICGDVLQKVTMLNEHRKAAIRQRIRDVDGLDALVVVFQRVRASDFLTGKSKARDGGAPFRATFDWVMGPKNFVKVCEGNYDNRGRALPHKHSRDLRGYDDLIEDA